MPKLKSLLRLISLALALLICSACGKTQVKVANSTGATLSSVTVSVYGSGSSNPLTFTNLANGVTSDAQDWVSDANLAAQTVVTGYTVTTTSNTLSSGKTNTLTLTLSSGNVVVTLSN